MSYVSSSPVSHAVDSIHVFYATVSHPVRLSFLRSILSVKDEFYHRHIMHHDLFVPVFETFRANPVGDNLVSSAIVEMCDFIHTENIKSLVEHIVTKHLVSSASPIPSLEDVSNPYVNTLTVLRRTYEKNMKTANSALSPDSKEDQVGLNDDSHAGFFQNSAHVVLNQKAQEDQRKYREVDEEESYFDADDDDGITPGTVLPPGIEAKESEQDMYRTTIMFSQNQSPLLNGQTLRLDDTKMNCGAESDSVSSDSPVMAATKRLQGLASAAQTQGEVME